MKLKRSTVIPLLLTAYLAVISKFGWDRYSAGQISALYFFGVIGLTLIVIVLLHFSLKKRERLRRVRLDDINDKDNQNNK